MQKNDKKLITKTFPNEITNKPVVRFDINRFDSSIVQHGYNVIHEKSLRCPCVDRTTGSSLPSCENCRGIGFFLVSKTSTKALMQGISNTPNYDSWTEKNSGTVKITSLQSDDVSYMDRFSIIDLEATYTQILIPQILETKDILFSFTIYEPLQILDIYKFDSTSTPLIPLYNKTEKPNDWDYYLDKNKVIFNIDKFYQDYQNGLFSVSVRYKHVPVYVVIDIQRELFRAKSKDVCSTDNCNDGSELALQSAPQLSIGRRLHYIFDANNFSEPSVFDNTKY